ncbi:lamin tail domain-containing protein [Posidoniimonas corsicana]|uniref:lamin tail domain-containing protein n=1 Tax=Posidoniimonas corsicana TaxID=1938618 RepID=UPI0018D2DEA7|nr:lamin tail domain-containing protein [Posidoniimonas corsicana]
MLGWLSRAAAVLTLASATLHVAPRACADVVISEIMYNPDGADRDEAGGTVREWVELYNSGDAAVSLRGWRVTDEQDGESTDPLSLRTLLQPGESVVLVGDAAAFDAQWGTGINRYELSGFPTLANSPSSTNETVGVRDALGNLVDWVNYDDQGGWPSDSPDGASISLRPESLSESGNNVGGAWILSMGGVYGARFAVGPGGVQDRASPGYVATEPQAAFAPSDDAVWSMVVLPDTQAYVKSSSDTAILNRMTQWIADNHEPFGVQFVLHEGDVVNQNSQATPTSGDQSGDQQWQNAKAAMSVLDGVVPYAISPGNHDYGTTNAQDRSTQYNDYFSQDDNPLVDPAQGGTLQAVMTPGELDNAIHAFTAPDGRQMAILATEWGPRQRAVDWAARALRSPEYADSTAVLLTHAYMFHDETRYDWQRNQDSDPGNNQGGNPYSYPTSGDTNDGEDLWEELVSQNAAFEMVFSGHVGGDGVGYLASEGQPSQTVHQMLFNTQFETNGGNGWLRLIEFLDDGRSVRVRTYSPLHDLQKTDEANAFEFTISPLLPGDYNGDGWVDAADYGVWRDNLGRQVPAWSAADGDGDGRIATSDYSVWRSNYGSSRSSPQSAVVPSPGGACLLGLGLLVGFTLKRARE